MVRNKILISRDLFCVLGTPRPREGEGLGWGAAVNDPGLETCGVPGTMLGLYKQPLI